MTNLGNAVKFKSENVMKFTVIDKIESWLETSSHISKNFFVRL